MRESQRGGGTAGTPRKANTPEPRPDAASGTDDARLHRLQRTSTNAFK
ncbi:hypothetical protein X742_05810 [Mesorhizobium sp. LNHC232B00]|nr:hypothetical protein X742_05810 [Mesorhizobium sp. LNHC232B00]